MHIPLHKKMLQQSSEPHLKEQIFHALESITYKN